MGDVMHSGSHQPGSTGGAVPAGGGQDGDLVGLASGLATDIAGAAVEQGRALLDNARGQAVGFADQRKDNAAQSITDIASSLRESGGTFEDRPSIQAFVGSAADGLDQLAEGIRNRSFAEIYSEVEDFARARPLVVGAATVFAGFLLARFIKSSGEELSSAASAARRSGTGRVANGKTRARPTSQPASLDA